MVRYLLIILLLSGADICLAQRLVYQEPSKLDGNINSDVEEVVPLLSADKQELYFTRIFHPQNIGGKYSGSDVWVSKNEPEGWSVARNDLVPFNSKSNNTVIGVHEDGQTIYLINSYNKKDGIAFSRKFAGTWTRPELIPVDFMQERELIGLFINSNYSIILLSMAAEDSFGKEDLYVSIKGDDKKWSRPVNLGSTINTDGFEISPFLSADGKRLYFASDGHEGYGDSDIYVSERLYSSWDVWTKPKNLGENINSNRFDAYFSIYSDSICFFASNRDGDMSDIYSATIKKERVFVTINNLQSLVEEETLRNYLIQESFREEESSKTEVLFNELSYELLTSESDYLSLLGSEIAERLDIHIELASYGDTNVSPELNDNLTRWRALNVANQFVARGVDMDRIHITKLKTANISNRNDGSVVIRFFKY